QLWSPVQSWMKDNSGFFYTQGRQDAPGSRKIGRAFFHRLGTPSESDPTVVGVGKAPGIALDSTEWPYVNVDPTSPYAFASIGHGNEGMDLYIPPIADVMRGSTQWQKIADTADAVMGFGAHGDDLYIFTKLHAPRYKIT